VRGRAWGGLLLALAIVVATVWQFATAARIETDLLALLPKTERNPLAEEAAARLGRLSGERVVFLIGAPGREDARAAAATFATSLAGDPLLRAVSGRIPAQGVDHLLELYAPFRTGLLSEAARAWLAAPDLLAAHLDARLANPFASRGVLPLAEDPFGFFDDWLAGLPLRELHLDLDDGWLTLREGNTWWLLVTAELAGSAFDPAIQTGVLSRLTGAEDALRMKRPEATVLRAGALFHAHAARSSAEAEVRLIGLGSLGGIVLLLLFTYRSARPLLLGLLSVGTGLCTGALATRLAFGQVHLMTLVFGASLIGEAIDYAIQYCSARLRAGSGWNPRRGLTAVLPALRAALATSVVGYAALGLTPFPALRQIAVFALTGLVAAWLVVVLVMPWLLAAPQRWTPGRLLALCNGWLALWRARVSPRGFAAVALAVLAAATPGWLQLRANDDVRLLIQSPPAVLDEENRLRILTGLEAGSQFFLIEGRDAESLLQTEEMLTRRLAEAGVRLQAVSRFVPSCHTQQADRARLRASAAAAETLLLDAGFRPEPVAAWRAALDAGSPCLTPQDWLASPLSLPMRHLWLGERGATALATVALPGGHRDVATLARAADALPGVSLVDKPGAVSRLFGEVRRLGAGGVVAATLVIFGLLAWHYGARAATRILIPTVLAQLLTLGILGHLGTPLTLFHVLALLLVLGVGINYAIFLFEAVRDRAEGREAAALTGVLLSSTTTLLAFGLLALSSMPALSGFGTTLALGIALAVLLAPAVLIAAADPT
jgi:predicted exporter